MIISVPSNLSSQKKFYHLLNPKDYNDLVCGRNFRPAIDKSLPVRLKMMIQSCWDPDYSKRPTFKQIAIQLGSEFRELTSDKDALSRSERMINELVRSFRINRTR